MSNSLKEKTDVSIELSIENQKQVFSLTEKIKTFSAENLVEKILTRLNKVVDIEDQVLYKPHSYISYHMIVLEKHLVSLKKIIGRLNLFYRYLRYVGYLVIPDMDSNVVDVLKTRLSEASSNLKKFNKIDIPMINEKYQSLQKIYCYRFLKFIETFYRISVDNIPELKAIMQNWINSEKKSSLINYYLVILRELKNERKVEESLLQNNLIELYLNKVLDVKSPKKTFNLNLGEVLFGAFKQITFNPKSYGSMCGIIKQEVENSKTCNPMICTEKSKSPKTQLKITTNISDKVTTDVIGGKVCASAVDGNTKLEACIVTNCEHYADNIKSVRCTPCKFENTNVCNLGNQSDIDKFKDTSEKYKIEHPLRDLRNFENFVTLGIQIIMHLDAVLGYTMLSDDGILFVPKECVSCHKNCDKSKNPCLNFLYPFINEFQINSGKLELLISDAYSMFYLTELFIENSIGTKLNKCTRSYRRYVESRNLGDVQRVSLDNDDPDGKINFDIKNLEKEEEKDALNNMESVSAKMIFSEVIEKIKSGYTEKNKEIFNVSPRDLCTFYFVKIMRDLKLLTRKYMERIFLSKDIFSKVTLQNPNMQQDKLFTKLAKDVLNYLEKSLANCIRILNYFNIPEGNLQRSNYEDLSKNFHDLCYNLDFVRMSYRNITFHNAVKFSGAPRIYNMYQIQRYSGPLLNVYIYQKIYPEKISMNISLNMDHGGSPETYGNIILPKMDLILYDAVSRLEDIFRMQHISLKNSLLLAICILFEPVQSIKEQGLGSEFGVKSDEDVLEVFDKETYMKIQELIMNAKVFLKTSTENMESVRKFKKYMRMFLFVSYLYFKKIQSSDFDKNGTFYDFFDNRNNRIKSYLPENDILSEKFYNIVRKILPNYYVELCDNQNTVNNLFDHSNTGNANEIVQITRMTSYSNEIFELSFSMISFYNLNLYAKKRSFYSKGPDDAEYEIMKSLNPETLNRLDAIVTSVSQSDETTVILMMLNYNIKMSRVRYGLEIYAKLLGYLKKLGDANKINFKVTRKKMGTTLTYSDFSGLDMNRILDKNKKNVSFDLNKNEIINYPNEEEVIDNYQNEGKYTENDELPPNNEVQDENVSLQQEPESENMDGKNETPENDDFQNNEGESVGSNFRRSGNIKKPKIKSVKNRKRVETIKNNTEDNIIFFSYFESFIGPLFEALFVRLWNIPTVTYTGRGVNALDYFNSKNNFGVMNYYANVTPNPKFVSEFNEDKRLPFNSNLDWISPNDRTKYFDSFGTNQSIPSSYYRDSYWDLRGRTQYDFEFDRCFNTIMLFYSRKMVSKYYLRNGVLVIDDMDNNLDIRLSGIKFENMGIYPHPANMYYLGGIYRRLLDNLMLLFGDREYALDKMDVVQRYQIQNFFYNFNRSKEFGIYVERSTELYDWIKTNLEPLLKIYRTENSRSTKWDGTLVDPSALKVDVLPDPIYNNMDIYNNSRPPVFQKPTSGNQTEIETQISMEQTTMDNTYQNVDPTEIVEINSRYGKNLSLMKIKYCLGGVVCRPDKFSEKQSLLDLIIKLNQEYIAMYKRLQLIDKLNEIVFFKQICGKKRFINISLRYAFICNLPEKLLPQEIITSIYAMKKSNVQLKEYLSDKKMEVINKIIYDNYEKTMLIGIANIKRKMDDICSKTTKMDDETLANLYYTQNYFFKNYDPKIFGESSMNITESFFRLNNPPVYDLHNIVFEKVMIKNGDYFHWVPTPEITVKKRINFEKLGSTEFVGSRFGKIFTQTRTKGPDSIVTTKTETTTVPNDESDMIQPKPIAVEKPLKKVETLEQFIPLNGQIYGPGLSYLSYKPTNAKYFMNSEFVSKFLSSATLIQDDIDKIVSKRTDILNMDILDNLSEERKRTNTTVNTSAGNTISTSVTTTSQQSVGSNFFRRRTASENTITTETKTSSTTTGDSLPTDSDMGSNTTSNSPFANKCTNDCGHKSVNSKLLESSVSQIGKKLMNEFSEPDYSFQGKEPLDKFRDWFSEFEKNDDYFKNIKTDGDEYDSYESGDNKEAVSYPIETMYGKKDNLDEVDSIGVKNPFIRGGSSKQTIDKITNFIVKEIMSDLFEKTREAMINYELKNIINDEDLKLIKRMVSALLYKEKVKITRVSKDLRDFMDKYKFVFFLYNYKYHYAKLDSNEYVYKLPKVEYDIRLSSTRFYICLATEEKDVVNPNLLTDLNLTMTNEIVQKEDVSISENYTYYGRVVLELPTLTEYVTDTLKETPYKANGRKNYVPTAFNKVLLYQDVSQYEKLVTIESTLNKNRNTKYYIPNKVIPKTPAEDQWKYKKIYLNEGIFLDKKKYKDNSVYLPLKRCDIRGIPVMRFWTECFEILNVKKEIPIGKMLLPVKLNYIVYFDPSKEM